MELFIPSFLAGVLTVLAPCVLSLLPVIIGGSVGEKKPLRPLIIVGSLGISVIVFTLLLKATTALIGIPQEFWKLISGGLVTVFGFIMLFPDQWVKIAQICKLHKSETGLEKSRRASGNTGAILLGASLGPVFTTCSPTYVLILAIVLPKSFSLALVNLFIYTIGMSIPLLAIGYGGRKIASKFRGTSNPKGWFKRILAILLILTGMAIITGFDKKIEGSLIERGYRGAFNLEQSIADKAGEKIKTGSN
ncbi:sulfite exporter TauE/SafE family protein [Candidatus Peregrinibacteria bacterium]|nr:sulfite exporter TauE/SafE family protein [Candidatus Peregrinibacteria bacterium]